MANRYIYGRIGPSIITDNLVLLVDAGDKTSYSESGTIWYDLSGNNYSGSLVNTPTFDSTSGGCLTFNGSNTYVDLGINSYNLGLGQNATISTWSQLAANTSSTIISDWNSVGLTLRYNNASSIDFYVFPGTGDYRITYTGMTYKLNIWYNIVGVMNGSLLELYINGVFKTSVAAGGPVGNSSSTLKIGIRGDLGALGPMNGKIALTQIYKKTLSASEILKNYNSQKSRFGL
jgi:hypothetical protein